jgi:hypothetical protein
MSGRHLRTGAGIAFMALGAAAVLGARWLEPNYSACAVSWVEVAHRYGFPALLFLGGLAMFNRAAFGDLVVGTTALTRRIVTRKAG